MANLRTVLLGVLFSTLVAAQSSSSIIVNDTAFYGDSPSVPPSRGSGAGNWSAAYAKAKEFVSKLTVEEKVNLTAGQGAENGCSGNIPPLPRVGFPGLCLSDNGNSLKATDFVSGYPPGLHVGASWNRKLAYSRGYHLGGEFRTKGVNVALGPVVGPLGRIAEGGRNWEGFSNDPYLSGVLARTTVGAMQSTGVITSIKHFIGNEQETNRNPSGNASAYSANIDDRTMHELYLWPFQEAVYAGSGNVMCSYNRVNNSFACQNSKMLNGLLKDELGFQGFVVTDWVAQYTPLSGAINGLDMVMPIGESWTTSLKQAVKNGSLPTWRLDDMATRIIAAWYQMDQSANQPRPGVGMPQDILAPHKVVNARKAESKKTLLQGAIEGHVLVKNVNHALPLKKPQMLSIFGYDAKSPDTYNPSTGIDAWALGIPPNTPDLQRDLSCAFAGPPNCTTIPAHTNSTLWTGGGSGALTPAYVSSPFDALLHYSIENDIALFWDFDTPDSSVTVDPVSDACLVFINAFASEGFDRSGLSDEFSDDLVKNVADKCSNTIVVVHSAGIRLVDQWIEHPNVTATILGHLPGQDSGRALVQILFGKQSPSGKLPYTLAKNESQYGSILSPSLPEGKYVNFPQSDFKEGVFIDYRAFDKAGLEPRFEFGYGLSYTTFGYSGLQSKWGKSKRGSESTRNSLCTYPEGKVIPGGPEDLFDVIATVTAEVKNTGTVKGAEVAQLYVGIPGSGQPARQLRGFDKIMLSPGQTATVTFPLRRWDLSVWDVKAQKWALQKGTYKIYVGSSSRKLPLKGTLSL